MPRSFFFGLIAAAAAWFVFNNSVARGRRVIPAKIAAEQLRKAWADHHTIA